MMLATRINSSEKNEPLFIGDEVDYFNPMMIIAPDFLNIGTINNIDATSKLVIVDGKVTLDKDTTLRRIGI